MKEVKRRLEFMWYKGKYILSTFFLMCYMVLVQGKNVYASTIQDSIYVKGSKKLAADFFVSLQIISAAVLVVMLLYYEFRKRTCEDNEESTFAKKQKGCCISLVLSQTLLTAINLIGGYYGISITM